MHILMISDQEMRGGAAIAASRLAKGLVDAGHQVTRLVSHTGPESYHWKTYHFDFTRLDRIFRRLFPYPQWQGYLRYTCQWRLRNFIEKIKPDVINLHNLHGAFITGWPVEIVEVCTELAPTVWTLHDMWSFTGRCAYNGTCEKFLSGCDAHCPTPNEYPSLEPAFIEVQWLRRKSMFERTKSLIAVTPSKWLEQIAKTGLWKEKTIHTIPNGLPLESFQAIDQHTARKILGLDQKAIILMAAAFSLFEKRKGMDLLYQALRLMENQPVTVITMGTPANRPSLPHVKFIETGFIKDDKRMALHYASADMFVHPAIQDNLPNTILEAIACGTPTVAFAIGGVPEIVRHGETGWLSAEVSPESLASTLRSAIQDISFGKDLRLLCRLAAETKYSQPGQAQQYLSLFNSLLNK